jgi:hypothetical protein
VPADDVTALVFAQRCKARWSAFPVEETTAALLANHPQEANPRTFRLSMNTSSRIPGFVRYGR